MSRVEGIYVIIRLPAEEWRSSAHTNCFSLINFSQLPFPVSCEYVKSSYANNACLSVSCPVGFVETTSEVIRESDLEQSKNLKQFIQMVESLQAVEGSLSVSESLKQDFVKKYREDFERSKKRHDDYLTQFNHYCREREGKKRTQKIRSMEVELSRLVRDLDLRTGILRSAELAQPFLGFGSIVTWTDERGDTESVEDRFSIDIDDSFPEMSPEDLLKADLLLNVKAHLESTIRTDSDGSPFVRFQFYATVNLMSPAPKFV